ncbi:MAG: type II toxin-antitoxin system RelE/ParE family toxin [bacterium]
MKRYHILITEPAAEDLHKIADYIAKELLEPDTAIKLITKIKDAVMSLVEMPTRNMTVSDELLAAQGIRRLIVDNYIVFYVVTENDNTVTIIRVLYGKRQWNSLL